MAIRGVAPLRSVPYFFTNDFIVPLSKILLLFFWSFGRFSVFLFFGKVKWVGLSSTSGGARL